jgi:hypothetical protein
MHKYNEQDVLGTMFPVVVQHGLVLPSGQKLTLGLLVTIILEVVCFLTYALLLGPSQK